MAAQVVSAYILQNSENLAKRTSPQQNLAERTSPQQNQKFLRMS